MLKWALIFLAISIVAGLLGFTGVSEAARRIAWVLFALFLILAVIVVAAAVFLGQAVF